MENFYDEEIPNVDFLENKTKDLLKKVEGLMKFKFEDFYTLTKINEYSKNSQAIQQYFEFNNSTKKSDKNLNEIKGIYIFYDETDTPIYIGISRKIFSRLRNHFLGKSHNETTLVYLMSRDKYETKNNKLYSGERKDFPLDKYRPEYQENMKKNWKFSIIPETDNYLLAYWEVYLACHLQTKWNTFETH